MEKIDKIENKEMNIQKRIIYKFKENLSVYDKDKEFNYEHIKRIISDEFDDFCITKDKEKFINFLNVLSTIERIELITYSIGYDMYTKEEFLSYINNNLDYFETK